MNLALNLTGVFDAEVLAAYESERAVSDIPSYPAYFIEYKIDSSRGKNHYFVKTSIINQKLYVFTVQVKEDDANKKEEEAKSMLESFLVHALPEKTMER